MADLVWHKQTISPPVLRQDFGTSHNGPNVDWVKRADDFRIVWDNVFSNSGVFSYGLEARV